MLLSLVVRHVCGWVMRVNPAVRGFGAEISGRLRWQIDWGKEARLIEELKRWGSLQTPANEDFEWETFLLSEFVVIKELLSGDSSFHSSFRCFYTHSTDLRSPDWFTRNLVTFSTILSRNSTNLKSTSSKNLQKQVSTSPSHRTVPAHIKTISRFRLASQMTANDLEMPHHPHRHHDWCFLSANRVHFINFSASPGTEEIFNFPSTWHTSSSAKLNYLRSL